MSDVIYGDFEWDSAKARRNRQDHGTSFTEATSVFHDPLFVTYRSPKHSVHENRLLLSANRVVAAYWLLLTPNEGREPG